LGLFSKSIGFSVYLLVESTHTIAGPFQKGVNGHVVGE
jgi:hypothetical protein